MQGNTRPTDAGRTQTGCDSSSDYLKQDRKGSTRKIPQRDGYDWNKYGKLMEIRKRHLARKFLNIWVLRTFGQIPPHTTKCCRTNQHQSVVLRRAFTGWNDEWWTSRKEWCLTTLASCHYKHRLYNLAFQHWQAFMSLQKERKSKVQHAVQFAHRQLMHLAWNRWNILRELRMKKRLLQSALELKKLTTLQSAWHIWQARLQQHQNLHTMDKQILKQRGQASQQRIVSKHCKLWWDCLEEAGGKHFHPLREVSLTMHSTFLLRSHFNHWRKRLTERGRMQELQHQVDDCFAEHMLSSCFKFWVELTLQRRFQKQRKHKADIYNQQHLCTWVFYTWWAQTKKHKDQMLSERLAVLHEERSHLQRAWRCWRKKINDKVKQTACIQMYLDTLSYMPETMWKDINTEIQDRRHQEKQACSQSDLHVRKWAVDKCKQTLIAWREETPSAVSVYHQKREPFTRFQVSPNRGLLQCFRQWRKEAEHACTEKINMERARWHHESKLLTKAMKAWNEHHNRYHENKVMKRQGIFLLRLKMYQKFFDLWKVKLQHRRREAELRERALWHWSLTLQAKVLYGWRWWVTEQHKKREQVALAAQVDRDKPPTADLKRCLTSAANMKDLAAWPTEDSQEQETSCLLQRSQRIQRVVKSCVLHWKQEALSKAHTEEELKESPQKKKSVTFRCTTPELTTVPSLDSVEKEDDVKELRKLLANRAHRPQPRRPQGLLKSPLANLHKQLAVTDAAALSSLNGSKADLLLGESSTSSLLQSSVYSDLLMRESGRRTNRVDAASSLTKELLRIQQDMNLYQRNRRQLRAWKKLKEVLQSWIQTSGRDDQSENNTVCQEIKELEGRIHRLSTELAKQKPKMLLYAERIRRLQAALTGHSVLTASH